MTPRAGRGVIANTVLCAEEVTGRDCGEHLDRVSVPVGRSRVVCSPCVKKELSSKTVLGATRCWRR